jgi:hypothetical protein
VTRAQLEERVAFNLAGEIGPDVAALLRDVGPRIVRLVLQAAAEVCEDVEENECRWEEERNGAGLCCSRLRAMAKEDT